MFHAPRPAITSKTSVGANHAMTRHFGSVGVARTSIGDGPGRFGVADLNRDLRVRAYLSTRNALQRLPYFLLKRRPFHFAHSPSLKTFRKRHATTKATRPMSSMICRLMQSDSIGFSRLADYYGSPTVEGKRSVFLGSMPRQRGGVHVPLLRAKSSTWQ